VVSVKFKLIQFAWQKSVVLVLGGNGWKVIVKVKQAFPVWKLLEILDVAHTEDERSYI